MTSWISKPFFEKKISHQFSSTCKTYLYQG